MARAGTNRCRRKSGTPEPTTEARGDRASRNQPSRGAPGPRMNTHQSAEQQAMFDRLARFYHHALQPAMIEIERAACGCDYGGTSWTTRSEAARVAKLLKLGPRQRFLDIGAGSGWPGLYLAHLTGCDVTLVDIPVSGLRLASERADTDRLAGKCWTIAADGAALPFENDVFDAIGHSDVLCCLEAKLSVFRECRRAIRASGRMVFTVISIAPNSPRRNMSARQAPGRPSWRRASRIRRC